MAGFKIAGGADLDAQFTSGNAGLTTGYKVAGGTDLGNLYAGYMTGVKRANTGYKIAGGQDLSDLFQNIDVPVLGFGNLTKQSSSGGTTSVTTTHGYGSGLGSYSNVYGNAPTAFYATQTVGAINRTRRTFLFTAGDAQYNSRLLIDVTFNGTTLTMEWEDVDPASGFGPGRYYLDGDPFSFWTITNGNVLSVLIV